jgi:hypothetical protein
MSNIEQSISTQPSSIDENVPNLKNEKIENTESSLKKIYNLLKEK